MKSSKVPITTSELVDTPYRRVVSLAKDGLPEIPVLGVNKSIRTTEGSIFHRHDCMEITYCALGNVKFDCGGRAYPIIPGSVFLSRPNDVHRLRVNPKGAKVYWIFLKLPKQGERFMGLSRAETKWIVRSFKDLPHKTFAAPENVGRCYERLFAVYDADKSDRVARRLKLRTAALDLVIALLEAGVTAVSNNSDLRFRALVDRMRRNPTKAFSMDETAAELKCAPNTVRALFHKYIGIPPQSFMLKCRIRKAQDLLKKGRSVMEIADLLGFSSSQNFAIRFRQETGMSPTDWKKIEKERSKERV